MKLKNIFDINGDGSVDRKDFWAATKIIGAAGFGAWFTASSAATAGATIVASGAASIASTAATTIGLTGGIVLGTVFGKTTVAMTAITKVGGLLIAETAVASTISGAVIAKTTALTTAAAWAAEASTGFIAGLPVVQSIALKSALDTGQVVIVNGTLYSVSTAMSLGLIAAIVVAGVIYYVAIKPRLKKGK